MDRPPLVSLRGVRKVYGEGPTATVALDGVDLDLPDGEFVVILGPSGSGKTTLLNCIGGIEPPTTGRIEVAGIGLHDADDEALTEYRRRTVGFVFQFFNLVPTLTALENVELIGELIGRTTDDARAALAAVGLDAKADRFPAQLSGGEQQRVAIARATVKRPPLLLGDEPTGSLDLETGRQVLDLLFQLGPASGRTTVVVTHNSAIARMAHRVVRMTSGRIVEVVENPRPVAASSLEW